MKRKISYKTIKKVEIGGFDYPIENEIIDNYDYENDDVDFVGRHDYGNPIQIDKVISILMSIKNQGANYVGIEYHDDHGSLLIEGLKIEPIESEQLTEEEMIEIENEIQSQENKILINKERIKESKKTIKNLKEKLNE